MTIDRLANADNTEVALLAPRVSLGSSMLYHGASKLSRPGIEQTSGFFEQIGIRPGKPWAIATAVTELLAGVLTLLGIGTRLAAVSVLITQSVAVNKVHRPKGFDVMKGGYEFNLALMAAAVALLLAGPGRPSAAVALRDRLGKRGVFGLFRRRSPGSRLLALVQ
ncbi:MAG TPA: DoxX family protein [Myxococcaceae bacterium]|jgi:putative oxidoreductase|nr:DoxX family protein [Myxococcaceae bacterium]